MDESAQTKAQQSFPHPRASRLLASSNYLAVNRDLIGFLGLETAAFFSELASECSYFEDRHLLADGWFFTTVENIQRKTGIKKKRQYSIFKELKALGLVETKRAGMPAKRYIRINEDALLA